MMTSMTIYLTVLGLYHVFFEFIFILLFIHESIYLVKLAVSLKHVKIRYLFYTNSILCEFWILLQYITNIKLNITI